MAPIDINNQEISSITLNGNTEIDTVEVDGQTVFTAGPTAFPGAFNLDNYSLVANDGGFESRFINQTVNNDGTKLYTVSANNGPGAILTRSLTTPFDISTKGGASSTNFSGDNARKILWNPDGTVALVLNVSVGGFEQFSVATPFDLTTITSQNQFQSPISSFAGFDWNSDGSSIYDIDASTEEIVEYNLTTPYDYATRTNEVARSTAFAGSLGDLNWSLDGTKLFIIDRSSDEIQQFTANPAFDITNLTFDNKTIGGLAGSEGFVFAGNGEYLYVAFVSDQTISTYRV